MNDGNDLHSISRRLVDRDIASFYQHTRSISDVWPCHTNFRKGGGAFKLCDKLAQKTIGRSLIVKGNILPDVAQLLSCAR